MLRRFTAACAALALAVGGFAACSGGSESAPPAVRPSHEAGAPSDAGTSEASSNEPLTWTSRTTLYEDATMIAEKVSYLSTGLRVWAQVCRTKAPGRHPVVIANHGGFEGFGLEKVSDTCKNTGKNDAVFAQATYRGEEGAEGKIEVCLGEVDDVLRMTAILLAQDYADPKRVLMWGGSHGGCITLRAIQRGAPVQVAIEVAGPTDFAADFKVWQAANPPNEFYAYLIDVLTKATGGTPDTVPEEYAKRSPIHFAADLEKFQHPLLIQHGVIDPIVPPFEACRLAKQIPGIENYRVNPDGGISRGVPSGCEGTVFMTTPRPTPTWPKNRYAVLYDDLAHEGLRGPAAEDWLSFGLARLPQ